MFAIFPSQNNYASVLCGSLSLIVSAAVNHDEIADIISETVTNITQKAARAANALLVVRTRAIRELFSELYAQVFEFYSDAIEWYMQSKTSRFFGSFNAKIKERYEKAAAKIEGTVTEMYRVSEMAHFAMAKIQFTEQQRRDDVARQRRQPFDRFSLESAGRNAQELLLGWHKSYCIEASVSGGTQGSASSNVVNAPKLITPSSNDWNRPIVKTHAASLAEFVIGNDGHALFNDGKLWLPRVDMSSRLHDFIGNDAKSTTLWVSTPDVPQNEFPSSRAVAVNVFLAAWQAEMPMISHFCLRPRYATLAKDRAVEEVGLIGMVYSLIYQLLQFEFEDDLFSMPQTGLEHLDGSDKSWHHALELLSSLLTATPHLALCLIDGLNVLAFSDSGAKWADKFQAVLFAHQESSRNKFRILLTTTGHSRVLQNYVSDTNRILAPGSAREVMRSGQWVTAPDR